jgi:hypothetical protein
VVHAGWIACVLTLTFDHAIDWAIVGPFPGLIPGGAQG